jgi:Fungal Zn(2)-Cys(6) binuclear cluster domain
MSEAPIKLVLTGGNRQDEKSDGGSTQCDAFKNLATWAHQNSTNAQNRKHHLTARFSSRPGAMAAPKVRRKAFTHKTRSGCLTCKRRHIKCGEEKPVCEKCSKSGFSCQYDTPRPWMFERRPTGFVKGSPAGSDSTDSSDSTSPLPTSLAVVWGPPEERRALHHWIQFTGPWLAHYANLDVHTWQVVFPRIAYTLPATRHILVAISMFDERINEPSHRALISRSGRILYHYNRAIQELTHGKPKMVDAIASSLLAWVLETYLHDTTRAMMHLNASSRLLKKFQVDTAHQGCGESSDIILTHLKKTQESCLGYLSTERRVLRPQYRDRTCIVTALAGYNGPLQMGSTREFRYALEDDLNAFERSQSTYLNVREARDFLNTHNGALLNCRHRWNEPHTVIVAMHLLMNLTLSLLPQAVDSTSKSSSVQPLAASEVSEQLTTGSEDLSMLPTTDDNNSEVATQNMAMDYVLHQAADLLSTNDLGPEHRRNLEETIMLILQKVIRYDKEGEFQERALQLMRTLSI